MKIVIVGVGFHIASRPALEKKDVVVIDKDPEALNPSRDGLVTGTGQGLFY